MATFSSGVKCLRSFLIRSLRYLNGRTLSPFPTEAGHLNAITNSPKFTSQLTNNTACPSTYGRAPSVGITGYIGLGNGVGPYFERNIDRTIFDNLSMQYGNHTIRLGFNSMWMQKTENASSGVPSFSFTAANGNDPFANFLLGQADNYSQNSKDTIPHLRYTNFEAYVRDGVFAVLAI